MAVVRDRGSVPSTLFSEKKSHGGDLARHDLERRLAGGSCNLETPLNVRALKTHRPSIASSRMRSIASRLILYFIYFYKIFFTISTLLCSSSFAFFITNPSPNLITTSLMSRRTHNTVTLLHISNSLFILINYFN